MLATDWNCPAYITPRYTVDEIEQVARPLRERVAELERRLAAAKRPAGEGRRD